MKYNLNMICCLLLITGFSLQISIAAEHKQSSKLQTIPLIKQAIKDFVYRETKDLAGQINITVGKIDQRIVLPKCDALVPFAPPGSRLWGKTSIGIRCNSPIPWTIYVQTDIQVMDNALHAARPLIRGQALNVEDILVKNVNLTQMPKGMFTDPLQVIGKIPKMNLTAGQPLRQHMLRAPYVILRGQKVKLQVKGRGFSVNSDGQALADAAEGQIIQVRNHAKRIISGIARHGAIVEVLP